MVCGGDKLVEQELWRDTSDVWIEGNEGER